MFQQVFNTLEQGEQLDFDLLARRFDLAMTKKIGVVRLPPAFWMQDTKINPRADHLLQVAMLLGDRERCDLVVSVLAVETLEHRSGQSLDQVVSRIVADLLCRAPAAEKMRIAALGRTLVDVACGTEKC
jgi:hypothetical protein